MEQQSRTRIKELCKMQGVSQKELAEHLGMREDSFSIALKRDSLSIEKLDKVAKFLHVGIGDLFQSSFTIYCPSCGRQLKVTIESSHE